MVRQRLRRSSTLVCTTPEARLPATLRACGRYDWYVIPSCVPLQLLFAIHTEEDLEKVEPLWPRHEQGRVA